MKLFIDTANIQEIKEISEWGLLHGVTTNPSLLAKETGKDYKGIILQIAEIVSGPISVEVLSTEKEDMLAEARELNGLAENLVIKIPMTEEGLKVVSLLKKEGIQTNVTLIFSPQQALLASQAGADYVSPFIGRLDDIGQDGIEILQQIVQLFSVQKIKTQLISASIRHSQHVYRSFRAGAPIATIPYSIFKKMVKHPLTDLGVQRFLEDWKGQVH